MKRPTKRLAAASPQGAERGGRTVPADGSSPRKESAPASADAACKAHPRTGKAESAVFAGLAWRPASRMAFNTVEA
jgi:hypothetical protein